MTTLRNTFELPAGNGVAITALNSALCGDGFDSIASGSGSAATYSNQGFRDELAGLFTTGGSSASSAGVWTSSIPGAPMQVYGSTLVKNVQSTVSPPIARARGGAAVQAFRVVLDLNGLITLRNTSSVTVLTATQNMNLGDEWLIRWAVTIGASAAATLWVHRNPYTADPNTTDILTTATGNWGTNGINEMGYGIPSAASGTVVLLKNVTYSDDALPNVEQAPQNYIRPWPLTPWLTYQLVSGVQAQRSAGPAPAQADTGVAEADQRSTSTATGAKTSTGGASSITRPASAAGGTKTGTGASSTIARPSVTATGSKTGTGPARTIARPATGDTGKKTGTGPAVTIARPTTTATAGKTAAGTATVANRSQTTASEATARIANTSARAVVTCSGGKVGTGPATVTSSRPATVSTGTKRGTGPASTIARPATAATGTKHGTGTASSTARPTSTSIGKPTKTGPGTTTARSSTTTAATRRATGVATVAARSSTRSTGGTSLPTLFDYGITTDDPAGYWEFGTPVGAWDADPPQPATEYGSPGRG